MGNVYEFGGSPSSRGLSLVVIINNISFYYLGWIKSLFTKRGIVLIYLPVYSPNLNLIKEFFSKLKEYI